MIKDDQVRRGGPEEERVRLAQQGKIEVIMRQKEEIDLLNIFLPLKPQPPSPPPSPSLESPIAHQTSQPIYSISILPPLKRRVILIEGAPGGGKSTLALHICKKWAQEAFFLNFDIVILAYLRDEAIQNASTLANILPADVTQVSQSGSDIATQLKASYGFKALFIFDGWDEFPPELQNNSLVSTIIREPHKLCLQQSTVIVTTRPVASGNLLHIADQRVEILGFTPRQIHKYIEEALNGDSTRIQKLFQHLEEHPVIEGYCYIPLHVAILVHIFLTMKEVLPTTRHELFCDLVLCCIVREIETRKSERIEITSLDDLPDVIKSQLSDLCLLAYKGVMQEEVVFYQRHLQALDLPSDLQSLGLLQAVEGFTRFSTSFSYNFLHLSVQELLAAYNISQLDPSEQVEVFKNLVGSSHFQPVLHFFCGFTKLKNPAIQGYISTYLQKHSSVDNLLAFLHCFFEAQEPTLCQLVGREFRKLTLNSDDLSPADHLAVGYFITSLASTSSATDEGPYCMQLELFNANEHHLKLLFSEITKYQKPITRPVSARLSIVLNPFQEYVVPLLFIQLPIHVVFVLDKWLVAGAYLQTSLMCEISTHESKEKHNEFEESLVFLTEILKTDCHLTEIQVHRRFLSDHFSIQLFQALQHNTKLVHLDLSGSSLGRINQAALTEMLQVNKTLLYLNLSGISGYGQAHDVFVGLQHNVTLVHLDLSRSGIHAGEKISKALTKMLQVNKKLEHLNLSDNSALSDAGAQCIFIGLQHNTTLVYLDLAKIGMKGKSETIKALNKMLQMNKTLAYLNLAHNQVTHYIFLGLRLNSALVHLNLMHAGITINRKNAQALTEMLQLNKTLQNLNLSRNLISDVGAQCICEGLQHNNTLLHLILRYTRIEIKGAKEIVQLLDVNHSIQTLDISGNQIRSKSLLHRKHRGHQRIII